MDGSTGATQSPSSQEDNGQSVVGRRSFPAATATVARSTRFAPTHEEMPVPAFSANVRMTCDEFRIKCHSHVVLIPAS